ncbi:MAG: hypothetical protein AAF320_01695 [Myxococcota bacterium]
MNFFLKIGIILYVLFVVFIEAKKEVVLGKLKHCVLKVVVASCLIAQPSIAFFGTGALGVISTIFTSVIPAISSVGGLVGNVMGTVDRLQELAEKGKKLLSDLGVFDAARFEDQLKFIDDFYGDIDTLTFDYRRLDREFSQLYNTQQGESFEENFGRWKQQSRNSILQAMRSHGVITGSKDKTRQVSELLRAMRKAEGETQVMQVVAEISAIQTRQLEELQHLLAFDSRAKHSMLMQQIKWEHEALMQSYHLRTGWSEKGETRGLVALPDLGETVP